jgi:predicted DNA-binding transcriptional regulator AlpA
MVNFLKLPAVMAAVCRSRASIYRDMKTGDFPHSVMLGKHSVAWRAKDIEEWVATRPTSDFATNPAR